MDEVLLQQLYVQGLGKRRVQVGVQSEHKSGHSDLRRFEAQKGSIAKHEATQVSRRCVNEVRVFVSQHLVQAEQLLKPFHKVQGSGPVQVELQGLYDALLEHNKLFTRQVVLLPSIYHVDHVPEGGDQWLV